MNEKPIIFSGDMVLAILEGRKTQTRRIAKLTTAGHVKEQRGHRRWHPDDPEAYLACPYGQPGDRLWVKETYKISSFMEGEPVEFQYKSDGGLAEENEHGADIGNDYDSWYERMAIDGTDWLIDHKWPEKEDGIFSWKRGESPLPWRPSIFMPRWASRITLEIKSVRIERLQEITDNDALAEGVDRTNTSIPTYATQRFRKLWDSINAKRDFPWSSNPFVWVVEFEKVSS